MAKKAATPTTVTLKHLAAAIADEQELSKKQAEAILTTWSAGSPSTSRRANASASSVSASCRCASAPPAWAATLPPAKPSTSRPARRLPSARPRSSRKPSDRTRIHFDFASFRCGLRGPRDDARFVASAVLLSVSWRGFDCDFEPWVHPYRDRALSALCGDRYPVRPGFPDLSIYRETKRPRPPACRRTSEDGNPRRPSRRTRLRLCDHPGQYGQACSRHLLLLAYGHFARLQRQGRQTANRQKLSGRRHRIAGRSDPDHPGRGSSCASDQIGNDIVTSDGTTLLGADNKAGLAEIMDARLS